MLKPAAKDASANDVSGNRQASIVAKELTKRFNREWIFRNFNFEFRKGNTYAIVGPNGSGKSTLLQVLWGQVPPTSGSVLYNLTRGAATAEDAALEIAIATPYMDLIDEFTLHEQLEFHFKLRKVRNQLTVDELLDIMYLSGARDKYLGNFSSGMRQRVKLGLAFYTEAELIFLDEPGTNLDDVAFGWYRTQLQKLPLDCAVLIASNNPAEYPESAIRINVADFKK